MKTYTNVAEWLKSKPSEVELQKVLDLINRSAKKEMRMELYKKEAELKKAGKFVLQMKNMGFKPTPEVTERINKLTNEVKELQDQLPTPVKREKKAKTAKTEVVETPEKTKEE